MASSSGSIAGDEHAEEPAEQEGHAADEAAAGDHAPDADERVLEGGIPEGSAPATNAEAAQAAEVAPAACAGAAAPAAPAARPAGGHGRWFDEDGMGNVYLRTQEDMRVHRQAGQLGEEAVALLAWLKDAGSPYAANMAASVDALFKGEGKTDSSMSSPAPSDPGSADAESGESDHSSSSTGAGSSWHVVTDEEAMSPPTTPTSAGPSPTGAPPTQEPVPALTQEQAEAIVYIEASVDDWFKNGDPDEFR